MTFKYFIRFARFQWSFHLRHSIRWPCWNLRSRGRKCWGTKAWYKISRAMLMLNSGGTRHEMGAERDRDDFLRENKTR